MLKHLHEYISVKDISFLIDFDKTIKIDKKGKYYYFKIFKIEYEHISNFIRNLKDGEIYLINPFISVSCIFNSPQLTLSRQFLISNQSHPIIIYDYLNKQFEIAKDDFELNIDYYFLILKYKQVKLDYKEF